MGTATPTRFPLGLRAEALSTFDRAVNMARGSNIASAGTVDLGAATGNSVDITGTTTITSFGTAAAGITRTVTFTGVLTLTHNGTSLKLPTSANITTAAGDVAWFGSLGSGNWECIGYLRKSGAALVGGAGGDASTNTASSVVDEIALFADTSGKLLKRSTGTGLANLTSGVMSALAIGTGVATALGINVGSAGAFVTFNGALGTPSSGTLTSCTGLPVASGISGFGTGVATALAVNVGTAGSVVVNGGVLGTPSSGTLTSCTGLPISTGVSGLAANVATFLATPSSANLAAALTDEQGSAGFVIFSAGTPTFTGSPALNTATAVSLGLAQALVGSATLTTAATTADQVLLSVSATTYRSIVAEISILSSTSYHVLEVIIIHDGSSASHTQYGDIFTGASLTTINSDINGGNVRLLVTPTNAVTVYRVTYRALVV